MNRNPFVLTLHYIEAYLQDSMKCICCCVLTPTA